MNSISVLSSVAMAVGLAAALPQIIRMVRTRSSGGQSVLGWAMGLVTNLSMAYVNLFGFGAKALMVSNVFSALLCVTAMLLILRFASRITPEEALDDLGDTVAITLRTPPAAALHHGALVEMPTTELVALSEAVLAARDTRQRRAAETAGTPAGLVPQPA